MKMILTLTVLLSLFMLWSAEVELTPTDDMYTDIEHPGTANQLTELWTADYSASGHYERIMMKFNLSELVGKEIESASLNLTRFYSCPSGGTTISTIYRITEAWNENSWNTEEHVTYDPEANMTCPFVGNGGNTIVNFEIDVKDFIMPWINGEADNFGFVIEANSNQKFSKFFSKEHSNTDQRPLLVIEYVETAGENEQVDQLLALKTSCYPNPFNPSTTISFSLDQPEMVEINIFNSKGGKVKALVQQEFSQGTYVRIWNGCNESGKKVSSGLYFYNIKAGKKSETKKMILMK